MLLWESTFLEVPKNEELNMPSFDVVSEINLEDARNAVENAERELATRFDFRGVTASFEWVNPAVKVSAESDFQIEQMVNILRSALVKRKIDTRMMTVGNPVHSGKTFTSELTFKQGLEMDMAKKIVKLIKAEKLKVQASVQGEQVRVTGKKRDDLQAVIAFLKSADIEQPLQFNNFRD